MESFYRRLVFVQRLWSPIRMTSAPSAGVAALAY